MNSCRQGLSMVEMMVAVVIIGLAIGPLLGTLSSSNKMTNASIFEEMAVHYGRELSDQLMRLSSQFSNIVDDARIAAADPSINLGNILNDPGFMAKLEEHTPQTRPIPLQVNGTELPVRLIISPIDQAFVKRRIVVTSLPSSTNQVLNDPGFWKICIEISWKDKLSGRDTPKEVSMAFIIKED